MKHAAMRRRSKRLLGRRVDRAGSGRALAGVIIAGTMAACSGATSSREPQDPTRIAVDRFGPIDAHTPPSAEALALAFGADGITRRDYHDACFGEYFASPRGAKLYESLVSVPERGLVRVIHSADARSQRERLVAVGTASDA